MRKSLWNLISSSSFNGVYTVLFYICEVIQLLQNYNTIFLNVSGGWKARNELQVTIWGVGSFCGLCFCVYTLASHCNLSIPWSLYKIIQKMLERYISPS